MKKVIVFSMITLSLTYCKTTQKSADAPASADFVVSPELQKAAEARYPGIVTADIIEGQKLYTSKCGKCHELPKVNSETEKKWYKIMDWMAPKAKMDSVEKRKTVNYILSARDIIPK